MMEPSLRHSWRNRLVAWQWALDAKWMRLAEQSFVRMTRYATWAYAVVVIMVWLVLHLAGDRWWGASLLLFGPRWLGLLPLLVLVPLGVVLQRRLLIVVAASCIVFTYGVMGLCTPMPWQGANPEAPGRVSLLTCNVQYGHASQWELLRLIHHEMPDVVALQEAIEEDEAGFPKEWYVQRESGLLLASPFPIRDVQVFCPPDGVAQGGASRPAPIAMCAVIDTPGRSLRVCNVHLTSPHDGLAYVLDRHTVVSPQRSGQLRELNEVRWQESEALSGWLSGLPLVDVMMGDFNLPTESTIYRRFWSGYPNLFSEIGFGFGYTRWIRYRNFEYGVRIDHILTSDQWVPARCSVARDIGSDHCPVTGTIVPK